MSKKEIELLSVKVDADRNVIVKHDDNKRDVVYALTDAAIDGLEHGNSDIFDMLANCIYYILASDTNDILKREFLDNLESAVPKIRTVVSAIGKLSVNENDSTALAELLMNTQEQ